MPTRKAAVEPKCSVLVVDDDELSREVICLLLASAGYDVREVAGGEEALALLASLPVRAELPAVILADLQMPGLTGTELAESLRAHCGAGTRLFVMSAGEPRSEDLNAYDGFLRKPFPAEALGHAMRQVDRGERPAGRAAAAVLEHQVSPVLDERVYAKLRSTMGQRSLRELYEFSLLDMLQRVAQMRMALHAGDVEALQRQAHTLRGGCGMVGASEIAALAGRLEEAGQGTWTTLELELQLEALAAGGERLRSMLETRWRGER